MQDRDYKQALHYLGYLLTASPDAVRFVVLKAESLISLNRVDEAIHYTTGLQSKYINNPEYLLWRGKILIASG